MITNTICMCSEFKYVNNGFKIVNVLYGHQVNKLLSLQSNAHYANQTRLYNCTIVVDNLVEH